MIKIVDAGIGEIPTIRDIAEKTWWPTYAQIVSNEQNRYMLDTIYNAASIENVMADGSQHFILLKDDSGDKAFASYGLRKGDPLVCKLYKLYILPDNQGKGYGKYLVDEIKARLVRDQIRILDVNVNRYNNAKIFYEKMGFTVIREEDVPIGPYWMNDYVLRLTF